MPAIGPGAHGRRLGMRTVRHRKPENFLSALRRNGHGIAEEALLLPTEAADEALVMGLRLGEGIDAGAIARRFGLKSIVDWKKVDRLVDIRPSDPPPAADRGDGARPPAARSHPRRDRRY